MKKYLSATFSAQIYATIVNLAIVPIYISVVGAEGFGLIALNMMLQAWLSIFDVLV